MTEKEKETRTKWHSLETDAVLKELDSKKSDGLSQEEVKKRLETYGKNKLPEKKGKHPIIQFLSHFNNVLIYVLLVAAGVTALMEHWIDTFVILAVVIANAVVGYIQEGKAEKALEGIRKMLSLEAQVIRDGKKEKVDAEEIVPGDIVLLRSGDKIPADIRILEVKNFRVEESPLTGESTDVKKTTDPVEEDAVVGDRINMAFSGTMVTYGTARGVVVETGSNTEIGKITEMISEVEEFTTPLLQKIDKFALRLSVVILVFASSFFAFGYFFRDYEIMELFMATIGVIVASIPEGLPAIITITLAVGVQRMAGRNAIIRRLPSVETLGSVSVICSDKTGTLTRNEMTVRTVRIAGAQFDVDGSGYIPEGDIKKDDSKVEELSEEPVLERLIQCVRACNDAAVEEKEGEWKLNGSPTEGALVTLALKAGLKDFKPKRIDDIPFESEHKYMATLNDVDDKRYIFLKGAPEKLLEVCKKQATADGEEDLDEDFWKEQMEEIAGRGQRLMGAAFREAKKGTDSIDHDDVEGDMIFLGVIGIIDPPREEVFDAIEECKGAGIRVIMITGDHAITAEAIAKDLGIDNGEGTITGAELEKMEDEELIDVVMKYSVFARTSPEHKLRLVKALQKNNKLCAMTGDGVNDAPALKRANIGVAMGIKGTEVSKDASEMVLADDNFATIVYAVEEGRTVYDNIRKTILFVLPTNGAEALVLVAAIVLGITMPITPVQILWVNMVTAVTLALALAFEPMEKRVMELSPRDPDEPILGGYFLWRILMVSVLIGGFTFLISNMFYEVLDMDRVRTIAVNTIVAGQVFYLLNCRQFYQSVFAGNFFGNKYVFIAIGALIVLQLIFTYAPFMNTLFETMPISLSEWMYVIGAGLVVLLVVELEKWASRTWFASE
ncbi:MAG: cation-transporting P-type ATPase [Balneolaceae bacterium]|nr:MAG: cation-transporting P-type ATPase [Balneolaceae bacterium]